MYGYSNLSVIIGTGHREEFRYNFKTRQATIYADDSESAARCVGEIVESWGGYLIPQSARAADTLFKLRAEAAQELEACGLHSKAAKMRGALIFRDD